MKNLRFVADTMLGDLSRWLRMLGYDTLYSRRFNDNMLLAIAFEHDRVLLTRDKGLARRAEKKGAKVVYVSSSDVESWLKELKLRFNIRLEFTPENTRCPICNTPLKTVGRNDVREKLPKRIVESYDKFWQCPRCGKIYWKGTHWITIEKILKQVEESLKGS